MKNQISNIKYQNDNAKVKSDRGLSPILRQIIARKQLDLIEQKKVLSEEAIEKKTITKQYISTFTPGIMNPIQKNITLIAEIKLASPTEPFLGSHKDILERAMRYKKAGADAISFITEKHFFKGDISFIAKIKKAVKLPVLQKDFVIDGYQIYEAKIAGSDAILLIARLLDKKTLKNFVSLAQELGIEPVVEVNSEEDLQKAIDTSTSVIAVNARDLETFHVAVEKACSLLKKIPDTFIKLGFSGIHSAEEVQQYIAAGAKGVLIGTSLMKAEHIDEFILSLEIHKVGS